MAQPIITQVTLSQLNALIAGSATTWNNNYWGTQFYVTDKEWLLHAHKDNICKPVSGGLTITNGDTLPAGIEPDVLLVDTGVITANIDASTGVPVDLTIPSGYYPIQSLVANTSDDEYDSIAIVIGYFNIVSSSLVNGATKVIHDNNGDYSVTGFPTSGTFSANAFGSYSIQAIIEFHKSPFPV